MQEESIVVGLKEKRKSLGLKQEQIATYCGVSIQSYHRWESGVTKHIKPENSKKLREVFDSNGAVIHSKKK